MRLGLGSYSFRWSIGHKGLNPPTPMRPIELIDIAVQHDLSVVQYADNMPLDNLSTVELDQLFHKAEQSGVDIELGVQSFNAAQVVQYISISQRLNAKILRVALDGPDAEKPLDVLAAEFRALLPHLEAANVRLAIENHFNYPAPRMVQLLELIDNPMIGVCLDVANSICAGEWPMETVNTLADYTINLHLKDYVIEPDPYGAGFVIHGCPLGQGRSDCSAILDRLPKTDMSVIMEHWLPRSENMEDARANEHVWLAQSLDYARKSLGL